MDKATLADKFFDLVWMSATAYPNGQESCPWTGTTLPHGSGNVRHAQQRRNDMAIARADSWGPFDPSITTCERIARTRTLRAIGRLCLGPRGDALDRALRCAEDDPSLLERALVILGGLAPSEKRRVWSSYAGMIQAGPPCAA